MSLKSTKDDKVGKIDLVSFNQDTNTVWLVELKRKDNKDTLLRCMLEVATYYQLLDKEGFIESHKDMLGNLSTDCIRKAVLIFKEQSQHEEIKEMKDGKRPMLKQLVDSLDITFFLMEESGSTFTVEEVLL
ncbi:MAG: hypothetical protein ACPLRZ_05335 [Thermovenabulum sp.]|uniref:hypothetical protein n=1 Tax=Thermovenabulum sp. TaxID=3100335 RepID=UPI003C7C7985